MRYVIVFFVSMVPLIELRGAIPFAYAYKATDPAFNLALGYVLIVIGNMLPVPFIFLFARRILEWGKDKRWIGPFFRWCLEKGEKGGRKLEAKAGRGLYVALLLFVGIPLPGTGAWTGTLAASLLDLDFKKSVLFVLLVNPLLGLLNRKLALSSRELALIVLLWSGACSIPGRGLLEQFTHTMIMSPIPPFSL